MSGSLERRVADREEALGDRLLAAGMSQVEALSKGRLFARCLEKLQTLTAAETLDRHLFFVPGRIEILGKHTDYAGGRSLLATVERGFCIVAQPRQDNTIRVVDNTSGVMVSFELSPNLAPTEGHWSNYPMTVARRLARNFSGPLRGADIVFLSDLPSAAGMSSSSALMIGVFKSLAAVNSLAQRQEYQAHLSNPESLAGYLATIENGQTFGPFVGDRGVGTLGGSEDHTAICCCRPKHLQLYSFCPARFERTIPLPAEHVLAIGSSGVFAEKTGNAMAKYNRASRLVSALVHQWRRVTRRQDRSLADAIHSAADAADMLRQIVVDHSNPEFSSPMLLDRLEHFLAENERIIPAAAQALEAESIEIFGRLVDDSQQNAERLLGNQIPQTIRLARWARENGAAAASAFGAGFGGSVWALVAVGRAAEFLAAWKAAYRGEFPTDYNRSSFFLSGAGPPLLDL